MGATGLIGLGLLSKRALLDRLNQLTSGSIPGSVYGANFKRGHHLLLKNLHSKPSRTKRVKVAIVGGGVSGLSCAYHLKKYCPHFKEEDVILFELEDHLGGNAHSQGTTAPWGAHYLPLPNPENHELLEFLRDSKILIKNSKGVETFDPFMMVAAPQERLFIHGRFQEGLLPKQGLPKEERKTSESEFKRFFSWTKELTHTKGRDGRYLFDIPMERSSQDSQWREIDNLSFKEYLTQKGFKSESLHWYTNYCCRDDYGTTSSEISAWAGMHYFCARRPKPLPGLDQNPNEVFLTWPEGNAFLVKKLKEKTPYQSLSKMMCTEVAQDHLKVFDFEKKETIQVKADHIVLAVPQFIQKHLAKISPKESAFQYTPWMVANLKIKWDEDLAKVLAWDNVNYHGKGLGFIVSHHQSLKATHRETTLTYYWPLTHSAPHDARKWALGREHRNWTEDILKDLEPMIFDLRDRLIKIDVWPWGHAMVSPTPGFMFQKRLSTFELAPSVISAHSDMSGLSLFEEAFYRGEQAALQIKERSSS